MSVCSLQWCFPLHQPPSSGWRPVKMFSACDNKSGIMDSSEASFCNICQAALVGRVLWWDSFLPEGWITGATEDHQNHSLLPHSLWAKAVHIVSHRWLRSLWAVRVVNVCQKSASNFMVLNRYGLPCAGGSYKTGPFADCTGTSHGHLLSFSFTTHQWILHSSVPNIKKAWRVTCEWI